VKSNRSLKEFFAVQKKCKILASPADTGKKSRATTRKKQSGLKKNGGAPKKKIARLL